MSFEDRVRSSAGQVLSSLVRDVVDFAAEDREAAVPAGRRDGDATLLGNTA